MTDLESILLIRIVSFAVAITMAFEAYEAGWNIYLIFLTFALASLVAVLVLVAVVAPEVVPIVISEARKYFRK